MTNELKEISQQMKDWSDIPTVNLTDKQRRLVRAWADSIAKLSGTPAPKENKFYMGLDYIGICPVCKTHSHVFTRCDECCGTPAPKQMVVPSVEDIEKVMEDTEAHVGDGCPSRYEYAQAIHRLLSNGTRKEKCVVCGQDAFVNQLSNGWRCNNHALFGTSNGKDEK